MTVDQMQAPHYTLSLAEQLYTARGTQGFGTQNTMVQPEWFNVDITDHKDTIYFNTGWGNGIEPARYEVRPLWTTKYQPKSI